MNTTLVQKLGFIYALWFSLLLPNDPVFGDDGATAGGIWVTVEGTAPFGEETSLAEAKARSRDDARRRAVEQVTGTFVTGKSVVYNYQLVEDLVQTVVRGVIVSEEVLEEGVHNAHAGAGTPALLYRTKLKAKVKRFHAERRGDLNITASLNKTVFVEGEEAIVTATVSKDAYVHVFNVGQDGEVTVLMPNRFSQHNFVQGGKALIFPSDQDRNTGIHLRPFLSPQSKKSIEKIKIIATTKNVDLINGKIQEGLYQVYPGKGSALITDLIKVLAFLDESEWTEATIPFEVRR